MLPLSSKVIRPASNRASRLAPSNRPLSLAYDSDKEGAEDCDRQCGHYWARPAGTCELVQDLAPMMAASQGRHP